MNKVKPDFENNFFDAILFLILGLILLAVFRIYNLI